MEPGGSLAIAIPPQGLLRDRADKPCLVSCCGLGWGCRELVSVCRDACCETLHGNASRNSGATLLGICGKRGCQIHGVQVFCHFSMLRKIAKDPWVWAAIPTVAELRTVHSDSLMGWCRPCYHVLVINSAVGFGATPSCHVLIGAQTMPGWTYQLDLPAGLTSRARTQR